MSKHISDELPRLLTGDATHDVVLEAAEHLRTCPDCQQELVSSVVAHASLTSAHRFAPEVVSPGPSRGSSVPSVPRVHVVGAADSESDSDHQAHHEAHHEADAASTDPTAGDEFASDALPDMTRMFDRVRAEAAHARTAVTATAARRGRRGLLAVAAAAVVLAGGGTAIGFAVDGGGASGRTVAMHRFEHGNGSGKATIGDDTVTLDASSLPRLRSSQRYEVWLTDSARKHMYSIGYLGDGSSASFKVKHAYLERFSAIEVSRQNADQMTYSGISVLRGSYA